MLADPSWMRHRTHRFLDCMCCLRVAIAQPYGTHTIRAMHTEFQHVPSVQKHAEQAAYIQNAYSVQAAKIINKASR